MGQLLVGGAGHWQSGQLLTVSDKASGHNPKLLDESKAPRLIESLGALRYDVTVRPRGAG